MGKQRGERTPPIEPSRPHVLQPPSVGPRQVVGVTKAFLRRPASRGRRLAWLVNPFLSGHCVQEEPMRIAIAGGHGQIALLLYPLLKARGHEVTGLIRNADQADDVRAAGAEPVVCDLEAQHDISGCVDEADAVVFAAGAGPGSGAGRKWTVDRDGALKLIDAAQENGIRRYVMISAMNVEQPRGGDVFRAYLRAKAEADQALRESGLDYTIIRPGRLTDEPPRGRVALAPRLPRGAIPRADVATVLAHVLETPGTAGHQWDLTSGDLPVEQAVARGMREG